MTIGLPRFKAPNWRLECSASRRERRRPLRQKFELELLELAQAFVERHQAQASGSGEGGKVAVGPSGGHDC